MINTGKLAGKTLFISGASRGIGKAIALKAARDGANVVVAAKTAQPHPKLAGTIYSAAEEIEALGGKCLPCVVDIQNEDQVEQAVAEAVKKFGGIDILVNNASAISLTGTLQTSMKKYDLMNRVNARGTYLCSQKCLPHLLKSDNPHILNLSPPLNMDPKWFQGHVAYTMAKYGMSMCVLGMAGEFKEQGVAVNALWPRTAIYTAAMEMIGGGDGIADQCRKVEIMSDAAYAMLCKDSRSYTGNFAIDDEVLKAAGITDMEQYSCVPGSKLMPDFFLEMTSEQLSEQMGDGKAPQAGGVSDTLTTMKAMLSEDLCKSIGGVFMFNLTGSEEGVWYVDMKNGAGCVSKDPIDHNCTMTLDSDDFVKLFKGEIKPSAAFMTGKLKIKGDVGMALKLEKLMGKMKAKL